VTRYEEPDDKNRWDSPLFTIMYDDKEIPGERIYDSAILKKALPPNLSTVSVSVDFCDVCAFIDGKLYIETRFIHKLRVRVG
jgi:tRNA uridine 5-carbamoylmethylation protein Kti12